MQRNRTLTVLAGGATAFLLALTAACGSSTDAKGSGSSSSSTAGKGSGSGATGASLTKSDIFTKLTAAQKKAGSYTFVLKITAAGKTGTGRGEADSSGATPAVHVALDEAGQKIETITVGGLVYFKAAFLGTDKWVKIDPKDKKGLGALVGQSGTSDPSSQLATLADAAKVTKGGTSTIDGTETTEYDVTVPGAALAKKAKLPAAAASALPKEIVYKLFVDGDELLRRLSTDIAVGGGTTSVTIDFADYGKPVSVEAPPAGQVTDKFSFGASSPAA